MHQHCLGCIRGDRCRDEGCPVESCRNSCGAWMHVCKMDDHLTEVCLLSEIPCPNKIHGCPKRLQRKRLGLHLQCCPASVIRCKMTTIRPTSRENADGATVATGPFDVGICGQFVRRDTYAEHMMEHTEIQSRLDGWFEARCPLASQGCPFVFRRWRPKVAHTIVRFNNDVDAIMATSDENSAAPVDCPLLKMPVEVQLRILSLLDGLSLTSISLTCTALRKVCAMLLAKKGCVIRRWESKGCGKWALEDSKHWRMNHSSELVRDWCISEDGLAAVQRHLSVCTFNHIEPLSHNRQLVMLN